MNPIVSVIIPLYNASKFIRSTLLSIQKQTLKDFECILVDDFSTDNGCEIIRNDFLKDKRFKLVSLRANSGACTARNVGLRMAKGRYVCFLDADDLFMRESLELRVKTMEAVDDELVIGTYCGSVTINENEFEAPEISQFNSAKIIDFVTTAGQCPFNANQPLFHTQKLKLSGGFDEQLAQQGEDYEYWIRLLRLGYYFIVTPHRLVCYRARLGSTVRKNVLQHLNISHRWHTDVYADYSDSNYKFAFNKPVAYYKVQLDIANRVFEFVGMALAAGENFNILVEQLATKLPSYNYFLYRHRNAEKLLYRGVVRQLTGGKCASTFRGAIERLCNAYRNRVEKTQLPITSSCSEMWGFRSTKSFYTPTVSFLPHKDYHVWTISLLRESFERQGINFIVVDLSCHYRDERVRLKAEELGIPLVGYSNWLLSNQTSDLIISFNDWDPIVRSILKCAQASNIPTATIVEGIQDYEDKDTKQNRYAYRSSDKVFLPGEFDKKYFKNTKQQLEVLGIPRIKELYKQFSSSTYPNRDNKKVLINSNFSYGVLEEFRDKWLKDVVEVCLSLNLTPVISRHPADKGKLFPEFESSNSFYFELERCKYYVSRFASGILEALAAQLEVFYYNPGIESVDKFMAPEKAYTVCESREILANALKNEPTKNRFFAIESFLTKHCGDLKVDQNAVLFHDLQNTTVNRWEHFKELHHGLDRRTGCFTNIKAIRDCLKPTYESGEKSNNQDLYNFVGIKRSANIDLLYNNSVDRNCLSIQKANSLFKSGRFTDAKKMYEQLRSNNPKFYFLDFNIQLCINKTQRKRALQ